MSEGIVYLIDLDKQKMEQELAKTRRALELAVEFGKPEDCGYCPVLENCDDTKCLKQLQDYFFKQAEKEGELGGNVPEQL